MLHLEDARDQLKVVLDSVVDFSEQHLTFVGDAGTLLDAVLQLRGERLQCVPSLPLLGDIHTRADIAGKRSVHFETRGALIVNPTVDTIPPTQPVLHREVPSRNEGFEVGMHAMRQVLCVHTFGPSRAQLLFHRAPRKLQPALVEEVAFPVRPRHPQ